MPSCEFRDLADAQRETSRALQTLTRQMREDPSNSDVSRLLRPLTEALSRRAEPSAGRSLPTGGAGVADRSGNPAASSQAGAAGQGDVVARALRDGVSLTGGPGGSVAGALTVTTRALQDLGLSLANNSKVLERSTRELASGLLSLVSGLTGGGAGGGGLGGILRGGFGLASLGLRIAGLFRGNRDEPAELSPFELPPSLAVEAANTRNILAGFSQVDRGQRGEIRELRPEGVAAAPQVVVNVSAMDSQSFMDRSNDIARAVRDAMIHMHPLNDVVGEI